MFIKFNEMLVDVSNCYFKPTKFTGNPLLQIAEKDSYAIRLFPVESDFGQSQHITGEYFDTAELRDKRFAELENMLCNPHEVSEEALIIELKQVIAKNVELQDKVNKYETLKGI